MENELIELQTQLAFQEHTVSELNTVVTDQQKQIDLLRLEIKLIKEKMGDLEGQANSGSQDEAPPHY